MDHSLKTEAEEGPSKDLQQRPKVERRTFKFVMNGKEIIAEYDTSQTVFGAIKKFITFSSPDKNLKEIIITKSKGTCPGAVVKTDFPCCLIEDDDNFKINLYQSKFPSTNQEKTTDTDSQSLVTFYIGTRGKTRKTIMKSSVYRKNNHYFVCVYSHKGVILREALQHDGRFLDKIFDNDSELIGDCIYKMNFTVDHCDGKTFELNFKNDKTKNSAKNNGKLKNTEQKTMQEMKTKVTDLSAKDHAPQNTAGNSGDLSGDSSQNPIKTKQEKKQDGSTKFTNSSSKRYVAKPIVNSEEIQEILRAQFDDLLKTLKQRENLKNKSEVQKFFRAEYDKSVQSFSEVKKVKQLMRLSDSVCQIRVEGSARGTGFLLFDRFVLTNAHVIGEFDPFTRKLSKTFTAVFGYEDLKAKETKCVPVKEQVVETYHGNGNTGTHLDYALLELQNTDEISGCPELLKYYSPGTPRNRSGICIVGHPDGGIKRMDPCFIIEKGELQEEMFIHMMRKRSFENKWHIYENQINYDSCFFEGSSGSPVFDEDCRLIGIHTGGYWSQTEGKKSHFKEFAYSLQPILNDIEAKRGKSFILSSNKSNVLDQYNQIDYVMKEPEES